MLNLDILADFAALKQLHGVYLVVILLNIYTVKLSVAAFKKHEACFQGRLVTSLFASNAYACNQE